MHKTWNINIHALKGCKDELFFKVYEVHILVTSTWKENTE